MFGYSQKDFECPRNFLCKNECTLETLGETVSAGIEALQALAQSEGLLPIRLPVALIAGGSPADTEHSFLRGSMPQLRVHLQWFTMGSGLNNKQCVNRNLAISNETWGHLPHCDTAISVPTRGVMIGSREVVAQTWRDASFSASFVTSSNPFVKYRVFRFVCRT